MLAEIEDAMIAAIKSNPAMKYLRSVESYGGQFDSDTFDVVRVLPAIWVAFGGASLPQQIGEGKFLTPCSFAVMCGARNVRGERFTRHNGPPGEIGVYQLLADQKAIFLMKDLGLPIDHFRPGRITTLYNTRLRENGLAVFAQEWHTKFVDKVPPDISGDLTSINLQYRLKPGDDITDASDLVKFQR
jgi:phage gp37-like protein